MDYNHIFGDTYSPTDDIMNDPAYDPTTSSPRDHHRRRRSSSFSSASAFANDPDTCRICRSEGTPDEPLFYPCKCSGSIKFVHQSCLMEWLSHSQKKHCELCKTPFQFTRIYDPGMPAQLPLLAFGKELGLHVGRVVLYWCRCGLVAFMWLVWLPFMMRVVWRGLFWLADGRWPVDVRARTVGAATFGEAANLTNTLSPSPLPSPAQSAVAATASPLSAILNFNLTIGEALLPTFLRKLLFANTRRTTTTSSSSAAFTPSHRTSLLSNVAFLNRLTPYPLLNDLVMDTLEGQIVTLAVVFSFIVLFLIREWVVQRQPILGLEELQAAGEEGVVPPPGFEGEGEEGAPQSEDEDEAGEADAERRGDEQGRTDLEEEARAAIEQYEDARGEVAGLDVAQDAQQQFQGWVQQQRLLRELIDNEELLRRDYGRRHGGAVPDRTQTYQHRSQHHHQQIRHARETRSFQDVWARAGGQPEVILRIIREEGLGMPWVVPLVERMAGAEDGVGAAGEAVEAAIGRARDREAEGEAGFEVGEEEEEEGEGDFWVDEEEEGEREVSMAASDDAQDREGEEEGEEEKEQQEKEEEEAEKNRFLEPEPDSPFIRSLRSDITFQRIAELETSNARNAEPAVESDDDDTDSLRPETGSDHRRPSSEVELQQWPDGDADDGERDSERDSESERDGEEEGVEEVGHADPHDENEELDAEPTPQPQQTGPKNLLERLFDYFWGDLPVPDQQHQQQNDPAAPEAQANPHHRAAPNNHAFQEELINIFGNNPDPADLNANADRGAAMLEAAVAADAAAAAAADADAVDDADDLEGLLELVGLHGPLLGLFQNAVFSALLIAFTIAVAIWLPYLWGKIALVLLTNPVRLFVGVPITAMSVVADVVVDTCIGSLGYVCWLASFVLRMLLRPLGMVLPFSFLSWYSGANAKDPLSSVSLSLVNGSGLRLKRLMDALLTYNDTDVPIFSVLAHKALLTHQERVKMVVKFVYSVAKTVVYDAPLAALEADGHVGIWDALRSAKYSSVLDKVSAIAADTWGSVMFILSKNKWANVKPGEATHVVLELDRSLAHWSTKDRIIAIIMGYCFVASLCMLYLQIQALFRSPDADANDSAVMEALRQAGGVLKVTLIIGIEMLVFPLYCGILLDVALLPLFENVTLASRIAFTIRCPLTSLFVHWFVGTCYMFHFALFVSMCRKLMRTGVLYFIRDPDDPTFHPVRDVLERSISTQLRKIGFSALIYGALIIVCCGGVVWTMDYNNSGNILPLRWTSHHPMLEFPVDLLIYNFVIPIATKQLKVSDWMYSMYGWWFRRCARVLRLSQFLLGERRKDEEGHYVYRTWREAVKGMGGYLLTEEDSKRTSDENTNSPGDKQGSSATAGPAFVRDGRYVRAPASDQVRIPKELTVFLEVTEDNRRLDGKPDRDDGIHGRKSDTFTQVYVPPRFKGRIMAFIFLIWIFVAVTGVGCSIGPLLVGRWAISMLVPREVEVNDIYAFSTGVYILGSILYVGYHCSTFFRRWRESRHPKSLLVRIWNAFKKLAGFVYLIIAFTAVLPSLFALCMEFYVLTPLHTTIAPGQEHVIYSVQDWALGVLYLRMAIRFIQWRSRSRPALALKAIIRNGWLSPDVRLATRAFILPVAMFASLAIAIPIPLGLLINATFLRSYPVSLKEETVRYTYPFTLCCALAIWVIVFVSRQIKALRIDLRDDVYLIGEQLHNFGERPVQDMGASRPMMAS